jgi:aspartate 1-decarboxylase
MNFGAFTPDEAVGHKPRVVVLDEKNEVLRYEGGDIPGCPEQILA